MFQRVNNIVKIKNLDIIRLQILKSCKVFFLVTVLNNFDNQDICIGKRTLNYTSIVILIIQCRFVMEIVCSVLSK